MGRVAGVIGDPPGFPYTPPGVDVLEGGKLASNNVAGSSPHYIILLSSFWSRALPTL